MSSAHIDDIPTKTDLALSVGHGIGTTIDEFNEGRLHSGGPHGPIVTDYDQAIAIALHKERAERRRRRAERRRKRAERQRKHAEHHHA